MSPHLNCVTVSTIIVCIWLVNFQLDSANAEIRRRSRAAIDDALEVENTNSLTDEKIEISSAEELASETAIAEDANVNSDLLDKFSWKCANNASCVYNLANSLVQSYKRGETIKLGLFDLVKLPPRNEKSKSKWNSSDAGRGMSTFIDFISGNAIRIPVGPMVFSVQRSDDNDDYIEVALLKKANSQGQRGGGGGGLFGGGGGGGGGGGLRHRRHHDKKQFQMFIPMYLAATTFGWTMVAAKAVGFLTIKALLISKVAFLVAAMVLIKKFMEHASDKMMYQFPEHSPYMMPYSMDYPMHAMGGAEIATHEMYPGAMQLAAAPLTHHGHPGVESLGAESSLHHNLADVHNSTQVLAALNAVGLGQKVKREDSSWIAKGPPAVRRPLVYNYLQAHHPFYRARK